MDRAGRRKLGEPERAVTVSSSSTAPERRADRPPPRRRPALRGRPRRPGRRPRRLSRRASCSARAERRRQDDALQRRLRRVPAHERTRRAVRPRRHEHARPQAGQARAHTHVPDLTTLPRPDGRGQPLPRRAGRTGRTPPPRAPARPRRCSSASGRASSPSGSGSRSSSARWSARSRTASSASSRWGWRARATRR